MPGTDKITRVLMLFNRLSRGEEINKTDFSIEHDVTERSIDRDIEDIRVFLSEIYASRELIFDRAKNVYYMSSCHQVEVSRVEIIALLKILISSRAFRNDEMMGLVGAISSLIEQDGQRQVKELVTNEMQNYISPTHNKAIMKMQWDLNQCIMKQQKIKLSYCKATGDISERVISPLAVVFSDFYFYLIAYIDGKSYDYPAFFRVDRIISFQMLEERYPRYLNTKYNVGEMRKCIKFMSAGQLIRVKLKIKPSVFEIVLDQLPNATIIDKNDNYIYIRAAIFKDGFIKWVLNQRNNVEVLEPLELREEIRKEVIEVLNIYSNEEENNG